jgi:putative heme transporter
VSMDTRADPVPSDDERPPGQTAAIAGEPSDDESVARPPSRRAAIVRTALVVGMLAIVFGVIVPRFVDYADVIAAFQALTLPQLLLMLVLAAGAWLVSGLLFTALVPGLSPRRGTEGYLILAGIGSSVPMGPWNMAVVWIVLRGWGVSIQAATSGLAMYGVINQLSRLAIPLIALILLTVTGQRPDGNGWAQVIAVLSAVIMVVATILLVGIARSERVAEAIAGFVERARDWLFRRLGRTGGSDVRAAVRRFRDELGELLRTRGALAMVVGILGQLTWCVVLIVALRIVGVPAGVLEPAEVLAVFGLTVVITIIPIAPGGAGIPELLYIAGLSAIAGPEWESLITAGVMLYRLFQWFLPIPIAWILLKLARRGRPTLPTMGELRSFSRDEALPT